MSDTDAPRLDRLRGEVDASYQEMRRTLGELAAERLDVTSLSPAQRAAVDRHEHAVRELRAARDAAFDARPPVHE